MGLETDASLASYPVAVDAVAGREALSFSEACHTLWLEAVEGREGRRTSQVTFTASRAATMEAVEGREGVRTSHVTSGSMLPRLRWFTSPSDSEGVAGLRPERPWVLGSVGSVRTALRGVVPS